MNKLINFRLRFDETEINKYLFKRVMYVNHGLFLIEKNS
jgi:hypothetical protein